MHPGTDVQEDHHRGTYFLVAGSENLYRPSFPTAVKEVESTIFHFIKDVVHPNQPVEWISLETVQRTLAQAVEELQETCGDLPVISLSPFYFPRANAHIHCNRVVSPSGIAIGVGNRPHTESLSTQVTNVVKSFPGKGFLVVDDTLFQGNTLASLVARGLPVKGVAAAFTTEPGRQKMKELGIVVAVTTSHKEKVWEMMPLHDFLPPLPFCGKVVGLDPTRPVPTTTNGISLSIPYLAPWISPQNLNSWATIPEEHAVPFSIICLKESVKLFGVLRALGIRKITDFREARHVSSIPYNGCPVDPEQDIVDLLAQALLILQ